MKPPISLIIDSGAYSAFTQGKAIDVKEYSDFCIKHDELITKSVNLDVIDPQGPEVAAQRGMENFDYMMGRDIDAMPVFHARERTEWLDQMLNKGAKYIGLSGTSLVSPTENKAWHKLIWSYATDSEGKALADFHAFGDTAEHSMLSYPWYSADSATWMIQAGRAARVKIRGKSYQLRSTSIRGTDYISNDDPLPKKEAWQRDFRSLGLDPDAVMSVQARGSEIAMIRSYLVASELLQLQERCTPLTTYNTPPPLLSVKKQLTGGHERCGSIKMYFVISPSAAFMNFPVLAALGITNVLVSYYYIMTAPKDFWDEMMVPFLYDPVGFCERHPKLKLYWDKLNECLITKQNLNPVLMETAI